MEDTEGVSGGSLFPNGVTVRYSDDPHLRGGMIVSGELDLRDILPGAWPVRAEESITWSGPAWATHEIATQDLEFPVRQTVLASPDDMTEADAEALMATVGKVLSRIKATKEALGEDQEDGAVIRFSAVLGHRSYSYAGHRAGGLWYLTGSRAPQAQTWDQFRVWAWQNGVRSIEVLAAGWPDPAEVTEEVQADE